MNRNFFRSLDLSITPDAQPLIYTLLGLGLVLAVMVILCLAYHAIEDRINKRHMYTEINKILGPKRRNTLS